MRLLVTGLAGQVATSLVEEGALVSGVEVVLAGRPALDLARPDTVSNAVRAAAPDVIVNAAAYTAVDRAEEEEALATKVNRDGAEAVARAAAALGVPIVHLSTDYVFDGSKTRPYREDDEPAPASAYGRSKLAGERAVAEASRDHVILRTAWVYSPFGANFLKTMLRLAAERDTLRVVDDQVGNPTYAPDIARGVLRVAEALLAEPDASSLRGTFHMTAGGETSWCGFAREIFRESARRGGPQAHVEAIGTADYPTPARRPGNSRLDTSRFDHAFGVPLPRWEVGLRRCLDRLLGSAA